MCAFLVVTGVDEIHRNLKADNEPFYYGHYFFSICCLSETGIHILHALSAYERWPISNDKW